MDFRTRTRRRGTLRVPTYPRPATRDSVFEVLRELFDEAGFRGSFQASRGDSLAHDFLELRHVRFL